MKADSDHYAPQPLERYTVGPHELIRFGGLRPVPLGRVRSLAATIQPRDYPRPTHDRQRLTFAIGGGTDSTAMILAAHDRGIRPDLLTMADTGSERPATYRFVSQILQPLLERLDWPPLVIVRRRCPIAGHRSYFEQLWSTEQLPSPAFPRKGTGRALHSCSDSWKVKPQRAYQAALGWLWDYDHAQAIQAIGFDADEVHTRKGAGQVVEGIGFDVGEVNERASLRYGVDNCTDYRQWYPLADWGMSRADCMALIAEHGLPQPGKSACFFCPVSKLCEVATMGDDARAAARELETRYQDGKNYQGATKGLAIDKTWDQWQETGTIKPGLGLLAEPTPEPTYTDFAAAADAQGLLF